MTALFLAALALTVCGAVWKKLYVLSYLGGLCWAAGTVLALVDGASLRELMAVTLALLTAASLRKAGAER